MQVARRLNDSQLATLLFDLLTQAMDSANVFDIRFWPGGFSPRRDGFGSARNRRVAP
jgi:hypothetical protein